MCNNPEPHPLCLGFYYGCRQVYSSLPHSHKKKASTLVKQSCCPSTGGWRDRAGRCLLLVSLHFTGCFLTVNFVLSGKTRKTSHIPASFQVVGLLCSYCASSFLVLLMAGRRWQAERQGLKSSYFVEWLFLKKGAPLWFSLFLLLGVP